MNKIISFILESKKEFNKVSWPSKQEVSDSTLVVIISVILIALLLGLIDLGLEKLLSFILQK